MGASVMVVRMFMVRRARVLKIMMRASHMLSARTTQRRREPRPGDFAHHLAHHTLDVHATSLGVRHNSAVAENEVAVDILEYSELDVVELDLLLRYSWD